MSETLADNPPEARITRPAVMEHAALFVPCAADG
jgi:hypothetical protein